MVGSLCLGKEVEHNFESYEELKFFVKNMNSAFEDMNSAVKDMNQKITELEKVITSLVSFGWQSIIIFHLSGKC